MDIFIPVDRIENRHGGSTEVKNSGLNGFIFVCRDVATGVCGGV
jgi:hypothetical protein